MANQAKGGATGRKRAMSSAPPASLDTCVVTYLVEGRAFQRIFEESNIDDMKDVVRQKLSLDPNANLKLAQLVEGQRIDLEDEADFDAFQLGTYRKQEINVEVSIIAPPPAQLASPSVTSSSINFESRSTKKSIAPGDSSTVQPVASSSGEPAIQSNDAEANSAPAPKKSKKTKLPTAKAQAADAIAESSTKPADAKDKGKGKQVDVPEQLATAPAVPSAAQLVIEPPKPKAKAKKNTSKSANSLPTAPGDQPPKKPKSKAASSLAPATEPEPQTTSQQQDTTETAPSAPTKVKKGKKSAVIHTPPDNDADLPTNAQGQPSNEHLADVSTVSAAADPNVPLSLSKKRGRESAAEAVEVATTAPPGTDGTAPPSDSVEQPPPAKKQRKSKIDRAEEYGPVAVTLPGPGRSRRKSLVASSDKPVLAPRKSLDAYADIMERWVVASKPQGSVAPGSGTELAIPAALPAPEDGPSATIEGHTEGKKKTKKKKKSTAPVPAAAEAPVGAATPNPGPCLVCQTTSPNPHRPLECPILSRPGPDAIGVVEERVADLVATQGPSRVHQMLISRLRDWLKERKKGDEAHSMFAPAVASTPAPTASAPQGRKSSPTNPLSVKAQPIAGPSRPVFPKKSKLSSVAVSRQSEGSSTEDEDILNSVMRHVSDSDAESAEGGGGDEEMADTTVEQENTTVLAPRAGEPSTPVTPSTASTPASPPATAQPSLPNPVDAIRPSQRMSQSNVLALLDDLEAEEADQAKKDGSDSDTEDSELARSTPSDVVRRRHRKSVRIETSDSDADDEDVEMEGPEEDSGTKGDAAAGNGQDSDDDEGDPASSRLSQVPKSSQSLSGDAPHPKQEDDIEEYESDAGGDKAAPKEESSSPIESPLGSDAHPKEASNEGNPRPPAGSDHQEEAPPQGSQLKLADGLVDAGASDSEAEVEEPDASPDPPPKRRGRPPLSEAVKAERAAQKARIQAEKAAARPEGAKRRGRPSLSQSQGEAVEENEASSADKVPTRPAKDANISSTSAVSGTSGNHNTSTISVEIPVPKNRRRSLSRVASSQANPDLSQNSIPDSQDAPTPRKRGRPPLSQAVLAEREAEKERIRAEKAIRKLEKRTAKANAKKSKGAKDADPASDAEDNFDSTANTTIPARSPSVAGSPTRPEEANEEASHPEWTVLKPPTSSSRAGSSQVDELEWSVADGVEAGEGHRGNDRPSAQKISSSMKLKTRQSEDDAEDRLGATTRASIGNSISLSQPLFMPSSGLVKKTASRPVLPSSSPLASTPTWTNRGALSQQTPTSTLARRPSISTASLPRFSAIKQSQDLMRQSRRASRLLSSQPVKLEPSQDPKSGDDVLVLDESSSDGDSSGREANATITQSQRKRRSAFDYFTNAP